MDVRLLGPLEAEVDGVSVVPSAGKPRQLFALLALNADRVLTVPVLMEEIWGEAIPRSAATTLQTYVLQLRRRISAATGGHARGVLVTRPGGYLLEVQPGQIDVDDFDRLAGAGRAAADRGDARAASDLFGRALAQWRGPALVDVRLGGLLELEVLRLSEDRLAVLERRIAADLTLGRHAELVPELRVLVARHPMHENFCAQLMVALWRSGAAWRALEAYQRLRTTLVTDLGLEPSGRLRRLQHAILVGDGEKTAT